MPIFVDDGITIEGPDSVALGTIASFQGFGKQPVFKDPAKVPRLELRDPAPTARAANRRLLGLADLAAAAGASPACSRCWRRRRACCSAVRARRSQR